MERLPLKSEPIGEETGNYNLGAFIELLPEAVVITDRKLTVVEFNHAVLNVLGGIERGSELSVGSEWQSYKSDVLLFISTGKSFEFTFTAANSGYIATFVPVVTRDGKDFVYCTLHPSGQNRGDAGLGLSGMIEAVPFPLFVVDAEGNGVSWNREASKLLHDRNVDFTAGAPFSGILEIASRPLFADMLKQCSAGTGQISRPLEFSGGSFSSGRDAVKFTVTQYDGGKKGRYYFLIGRTHRKYQASASSAGIDDEAVKLLHLLSETEQFLEKDGYFSKMAQGIADAYDAGAVIIFEEAEGMAKVIGETACPVGISRRLLSCEGGNIFESELMRSGEETVVTEDSQYQTALRHLYTPFERLVSIPLVYDGRSVGAIFMLYMDRGPAEEDDHSYLTVLSGIAARKLTVFRRIQGIRLELQVHSTLWDIVRKLEKSFRSSQLYQSLSRELRYLFSGYASFTFFRTGDGTDYTMVAADGAKPEGKGKSAVSGETFDGQAIKSDVWILGKEQKSLREALQVDAEVDVVIVRHASPGLYGFTAVACREKIDAESAGFYAARMAVGHINFIISSVREIERQERSSMRARLLNMLAETSMSYISDERRLDEILRCVRESFRPDETAIFSLKDGVYAGADNLRMAKNMMAAETISKQLQSEISACAASLDCLKAEVKTDGRSAVGTEAVRELLLIPAGSAGGVDRVVSVMAPEGVSFSFDDIEFAEVLSAIVSRSERQRRKMADMSDSELFYKSLATAIASFNAHFRDRPRAETLSKALYGIIPHDDLELLADTGDGFARRKFTLREKESPGSHALISLSDVYDSSHPDEGNCLTRNNTRIPSLFGQSVGSALVCRITDGGSPWGSVVLWRKSPWAFSKREGRMFEAVVGSVSPFLIDEAH